MRRTFVLSSLLLLAACPEPPVEEVSLDAGAPPAATVTVLTRGRAVLSVHDRDGRWVSEVLADADGESALFAPADGSITQRKGPDARITVTGVREGDRISFLEAAQPASAGEVEVRTDPSAATPVATFSRCGRGDRRLALASSPCAGPVVVVSGDQYATANVDLVAGRAVTVGAPWRPVPRRSFRLTGVPAGATYSSAGVVPSTQTIDGDGATVSAAYLSEVDTTIVEQVMAGQRRVRWSRPASAFGGTASVDHRVELPPAITASRAGAVVSWTISGAAPGYMYLEVGTRWIVLADPARGSVTLPAELAQEPEDGRAFLVTAADADWATARTAPRAAYERFFGPELRSSAAVIAPR